MEGEGGEGWEAIVVRETSLIEMRLIIDNLHVMQLSVQWVKNKLYK